MTTGALAHLRRKPGRPRKTASGHSAGIPCEKRRVNRGQDEGTLAKTAIAPRLLDLPKAAAYLGVSAWTVRDLADRGVLPRVRIPLPGCGELRKLLFDKADLDRLIEAWKESGP